MNKKIIPYLIFSCLTSITTNSMENMDFDKYYISGEACPQNLGRFSRKREQHMCWLLSGLYFRMRPDLVEKYNEYSKKSIDEIINECDKYADVILKSFVPNVRDRIFGTDKEPEYYKNNNLVFLRSLYASMIKTTSLMFYKILKNNESFDVLDGKYNNPSIINLTNSELSKISNLVGVPILKIDNEFGLGGYLFDPSYPLEDVEPRLKEEIQNYRSGLGFSTVDSFWGLQIGDHAKLIVSPLLYPMGEGSLILVNERDIQNKINEDGIIEINGKNYKCISMTVVNNFGGGHGFCYQIKYDEKGKYAGCILRSSSYYPDANFPGGKFTDIFERTTHKDEKTGEHLIETVERFHLLDNDIYEQNKEFYCYKN